MPNIDAVAGSVNRLSRAQREGKIPEDISPDLAAILESMEMRLTVVKATTAREPSEEILAELKRVLFFSNDEARSLWNSL